MRTPTSVKQFATIASVAIGAIVFATCNKGSSDIAVPHPAASEVNPTPWVKAFVKLAKAYGSGGVKMDGTMTTDSAVWYLEAGLNYSLATSWVEYTNVLVDSLVVTCVLNGDGTVDEAEVFSAFNEAADLLEEIPDESQHLVVIDAQGSLEPGQLSIQCVYVIGSGYEQTLNTTYGSGDDYMWWQTSTPSPSCACEDNTQPNPHCANYHIQKRINNEVNGGVMGYWTDIEAWTITVATDLSLNQIAIDVFEGDPSPPPGHENMFYKVFSCDGGWDCDNCLDQDDMAFHTQGTYDAMYELRDLYCCPSKTPIGCVVGGDLHFAPPPHTHHIATFRYGKDRRF